MASGYEFDVFLSYRRSGRGNAAAWVRHHFHPLLVDCLADELDHPPRVYVDLETEIGAYWPGLLEQRLQRSRVLVAVLSPRYFESSWCLAEWHTARAREEALGMATKLNPGTSVIYPVVFSDSESFPEDAQTRQARVLKQWNNPRPGYRDTPAYDELYDEVKRIAVELRGFINNAPAWQPDWPTCRPSTGAESEPASAP